VVVAAILDGVRSIEVSKRAALARECGPMMTCKTFSALCRQQPVFGRSCRWRSFS